MANLEGVKNRVRQILDDADGARFNDMLVENAVRQALARLDERLPLVCDLEITVAVTGREQTLSGLINPLYLVKVVKVSGQAEGREEEIPAGFTCTLAGSNAVLHFGGRHVPQTGEKLHIRYASRNTLCGLDGAEATTLPAAALAALECAAAATACLLRAAAVSEAYGARPGESARLVEQSRIWAEAAQASLASLKSLQEFASPRGFALDEWDREGRQA